jgi:Permease for cytosine/purines, uracil, thiamine, allantoin
MPVQVDQNLPSDWYLSLCLSVCSCLLRELPALLAMAATFLAGCPSIRLMPDPPAPTQVEKLAAPMLLAMSAALLTWAVSAAGGFGPMLAAPSRLATPRQFLSVFFPALTANVGFWATLSLNIPDFTRLVSIRLLGDAVALHPRLHQADFCPSSWRRCRSTSPTSPGWFLSVFWATLSLNIPDITRNSFSPLGGPLPVWQPQGSFLCKWAMLWRNHCRTLAGHQVYPACAAHSVLWETGFRAHGIADRVKGLWTGLAASGVDGLDTFLFFGRGVIMRLWKERSRLQHLNKLTVEGLGFKGVCNNWQAVTAFPSRYAKSQR